MSAWDLASRLRPSRIHLGLLAGLYLLCLVAIWLSSGPLWHSLAGTAAWMASAALCLQGRRRLQGESVGEVHWAGDRMTVVLASGQRIRVSLERAEVWRWLVVLHVRAVDIGWREQILLLPDSLPASEFRRWRVRLLAGR